ncbi:MAG: hypothetical protein OXE57_20370 [Alphaproteobacteria bacterium]|nr:hypothetical protein [Alphaproteobacteria bacterium]
MEGGLLIARYETKRDGGRGLLSVYCDGVYSWRRFAAYQGWAWDLPPRLMSAKDRRLWEAAKGSEFDEESLEPRPGIYG